ncbi:MAG TPA: ThiF family adenylyltransferase, partial [Blastocatellia bacterium]
MENGLKTVILVGAGGNIGSHLAPHLARMPEVGRVTLIDKDFYESTNLRSQDITARDVGKSKAAV